MQLRLASSIAMLLVAGFGASLRAQEAAPVAAGERPPRVLFNEVEMARFQAIAAEMAAKRESYIRASEDDEIVLLEPYVVEGDNSLWRARIRRALEHGGGIGRRRIFVGLAEPLRQELMFARRSQDEFFRPGSAGRPDDAPGFDGIDLMSAPAAIFDAVRQRRVLDLFRAPPGKVGE